MIGTLYVLRTNNRLTKDHGGLMVDLDFKNDGGASYCTNYQVQSIAWKSSRSFGV